MRNRLAIRHFFRGALRIDMNPLMVTRCFGKLINPVLVNDHPFGYTDLLAFEFFRVINGCNYSHRGARDTQMILRPQVFAPEFFC